MKNLELGLAMKVKPWMKNCLLIAIDNKGIKRPCWFTAGGSKGLSILYAQFALSVLSQTVERYTRSMRFKDSLKHYSGG